MFLFAKLFNTYVDMLEITLFFVPKISKCSSKDLNTQHEIQKRKSKFYYTPDQINSKLEPMFPHIYIYIYMSVCIYNISIYIYIYKRQLQFPKVRKSRVLQLFFFSGIENVGCKKRMCLCSPRFFLKQGTPLLAVTGIGWHSIHIRYIINR